MKKLMFCLRVLSAVSLVTLPLGISTNVSTAHAGHLLSGEPIYISRAVLFVKEKTLLMSFVEPIHHHIHCGGKMLEDHIQHVAIKFQTLRDIVQFRDNEQSIAVDKALPAVAIHKLWPIIKEDCSEFEIHESIINGEQPEKVFHVRSVTIHVYTESIRNDWLRSLDLVIDTIRSEETKSIRNKGAGNIGLNIIQPPQEKRVQ